MKNKAFTLVELLVVVLIIGVLTAVALPMYQGAVDKSHWSTMLPASKAIKDAEEAFKMTNGEYSDTMEHLDVQISNSDLQFDLQTPNNLSQPNVIRVTNSKLDGVRLASYLDDSPMFAGQLHCEAKTGDERAKRLCSKLLNGEELPEAEGYNRYLLDQSITQEICKDAQGSWSTSKTQCYKDDQTRCDALHMGYLGDGQCGYENGGGYEVGAEGVCKGTVGQWYTGGCGGSTYKAGSQCIGKTGATCSQITLEKGAECIGKAVYSCTHGSTFKGTVICQVNNYCGFGSTFDGGICVANVNGSTCSGSTFKNGAVCYANKEGSCGNHGTDLVSYQDTACCCGKCPEEAPKCASSRCDPYYMDPNNFKNL